MLISSHIKTNGSNVRFNSAENYDFLSQKMHRRWKIMYQVLQNNSTFSLVPSSDESDDDLLGTTRQNLFFVIYSDKFRCSRIVSFFSFRDWVPDYYRSWDSPAKLSPEIPRPTNLSLFPTFSNFGSPSRPKTFWFLVPGCNIINEQFFYFLDYDILDEMSFFSIITWSQDTTFRIRFSKARPAMNCTFLNEKLIKIHVKRCIILTFHWIYVYRRLGLREPVPIARESRTNKVFPVRLKLNPK